MRWIRRLSVATIGLSLLGAPAASEPLEIRIARSLDLLELPLLVMQTQRLIEKQIQARGLGIVTVQWGTPPRGGGIEALAAGQADLAAVDLAVMVAAWDQREDTPQRLRALGTLGRMPFVLVTRNPAIRTIRDFGDKDRIAVPGRGSGPAVMLEMAAAREWGIERFNRLAPITLARPDREAAEALASGKGGIDAHFSRLPYVDAEMARPGVRRVMDSFDVGGPHSVAALAATVGFRDANPVLCAAILAALDDAQALIRTHRGAAAEIYVAMSGDKDAAIEDLADMMGDPDLNFTTAPAGIMRLADFMQQTGRIKRRPSRWQDLFFAEAHTLPGD